MWSDMACVLLKEHYLYPYLVLQIEIYLLLDNSALRKKGKPNYVSMNGAGEAVIGAPMRGPPVCLT